MNTGANSIRLDRQNSRCLGVCAGIANWLDIPASLVRIVCVICVIAWPPFLVGYFILYFCLDKDITPEKVQDYFRSAKTADHFRELDYRKPIYRNERDKRIAGVCAGIADYLEVSAFTVRVVTLGSLFIFGPFTFWAYVICWFVFDPDPALQDDVNYGRRTRRRERQAARRARRAARKSRRKSYVNEEIQVEMEDMEADISDALDEVEVELKAEFDAAGNGFGEASKRRGRKDFRDRSREPRVSRAEVTSIFSELENRLREIEAFMTSKKFRLHCQINRI